MRHVLHFGDMTEEFMAAEFCQKNWNLL